MKKNEAESSFIVGAFVSLAFALIGVVFRLMLIPMTKFLFKLLMKQVNVTIGQKPTQTQPETQAQLQAIPVETQLPTPDIFKGAANLARAKEFNLLAMK